MLTPSADTGTRLFGVRRRDHDGAIVLKVCGTVDVVTAPTLATHLDVALTGQPAVVVVDLLQVDLLSAAGINLLVETYLLAQQAGTSLRVAANGRTTSRLMHLVGVSTVIELYPTVPDALRGPPPESSPLGPIGVAQPRSAPDKQWNGNGKRDDCQT